MPNSSRIVNVNLTFRHTEATDALKTYATDKLRHCLLKFAHQDIEAHLVLRVEKNRQIAEVSFNAEGTSFAGKEEKDDLYAAIDALVDSMGQQLRKHKEKITAKH
jgi:putative sigma-54 modulation protein